MMFDRFLSRRPARSLDHATSRRKSQRNSRRRFVEGMTRRAALQAELLEDRRVLSVFYDLEIIAQKGGTSHSGVMNEIEPDVSVNERGRVAFVAELNTTSPHKAVMVGPFPPGSLLAPAAVDISTSTANAGYDFLRRSCKPVAK